MKLILILVIVFYCFLGYSQKMDTISNPLEKVFQENYDSTIFYHSYSVFEDNPDFYIVGKKDDTIYYYHYYISPTQYPTKENGPFNSDIRKLFMNRYLNNRRNNRISKIYSKIDLDDNFFWVTTEVSKGSLWEMIQNENIWNFVDDRNEKLKNEVIANVIDGGGCYFKLITRDKVTFLSYWVPGVYPENNKNHIRNRIIEIESLINKFYSTHKIQYKF